MNVVPNPFNKSPIVGNARLFLAFKMPWLKTLRIAPVLMCYMASLPTFAWLVHLRSLVYVTLSSCIWRYLDFLDGWRDRTVTITQMVLGKVAIRDSLTCVLSLLKHFYGRATAKASVVGLPQGRPVFNSRQCVWDFYSSDPDESSPLPHNICCSDIYHIPCLPRSLAWPFPSRLLVSFCMRFTSAVHILIRHSHPFRFVRPSNAECAKSYVAALMKYCENTESLSTVRSHDMGKFIVVSVVVWVHRTFSILMFVSLSVYTVFSCLF